MIQRSTACTGLKERLAALITESSLPEYSFSEVACGLAGLASENGTLNSRYYYLLFSSLKSFDLSTPILFPQRVPRLGFFDELLEVSPVAGKRIGEIRNVLQNYVDRYLMAGSCPEEEMMELNFLKLALRFGAKCGEVTTDLANIPESHRLTLIDILINGKVSLDEDIDFSPLFRTLELSTHSTRYSVMNRIIVASARYNSGFFKKNPDLIRRITADLEEGLSELPLTDNSSRISAATLYRGLPMSPAFDSSKTLTFLLRAEEILNGMEVTSELSKTVQKENLATLYLTLSKYFLYQEKSEEEYEMYLRRIMDLDPYDSAAFGELALRKLKTNKLDEAEELLRISLTLGPPSLGMHHYFLGEVLLLKGEDTEALETFSECEKLDPLAVSPSLKKFELLKGLDRDAAKAVAQRILNSADLTDQLTMDEKCALQNY